MYPCWKGNKTVFADDMILSTENPKESTRKLSEPNYEFNKFAGNKINIQKSTEFLYICNEHAKKKIPFTIVFKKRMNKFNKKMQILYSRNHKPLLK